MQQDDLGCCPGESNEVNVLRVVLNQDDGRKITDLIGKNFPLTTNATNYKAASFLSGLSRIKPKSVSDYDIETKANALRQIASGALTAAIPGDLSPVRSPIRSAFWRTVTPGGGGRGGSRPGEGRGYRCPEGYQYGGRFTDSRLSTCGQKLFDIPSPLRMALAAIASAARSRAADRVSGSPLGAGEYPDDMIERRKPAIPKVSLANPRKAQIQIREMMSQIADYGDDVARMVRRDGFVLEPVVPASVLRAIPDNRDMEGATYLMFAKTPSSIGNDELGLLSNTGITNVTYILPSGSTLSIEKARKLTTGERRKLGRTVNTAIESDQTGDPASRLRMVANEMGDGIRVREKLVGAESLADSFKAKKAPERAELPREAVPARITSKGKITSLENAIEHLASGGSLSRIAPEIMPAVLRSSREIQEQRLENNQRLITIGDKKYFLYTRPERYQHIAERFASAVQQHLGLNAPDVIFAGMPNESRPYIREDVETAVPGGKLNTEVVLGDLNPRDIAAMMVSDFLTDQRTRENTSIYPIDANGETRPVLAQNFSSGLTALDEIEISKRTKMGIDEFYAAAGVPRYSEYYQELKQQQQAVFQRFIQELIQRARQFRFSELKKNMSRDGLSDGERAHIEIVERLFENRLKTLSRSKRSISELLEG